MRSLSFALFALCALSVVVSGQYGGPKKGAVIPGKYDDLKGDEKGPKAQDDVLYVKGQPVEGGKDEPIDDYGGKFGAEKKVKDVKAEEGGFDLGSADGGAYGDKPKQGKKKYGGGGYGLEGKDTKYNGKDKFGGEEPKLDGPKLEDPKFDEPKSDKGYGKDVKEEKYDEKDKFGSADGGKLDDKGYGGGAGGDYGAKEDKKYGYGDAGLPKGDEGKLDDKGYGGGAGGGYGGKEDKKYGGKGGYGDAGLPKGDEGGFGPEPVNPKESYGGWGPKKGGYGKQEGKSGGYGGGKLDEAPKDDGYGKGGDEGKFAKEGAYGDAGKGGFGEEKFGEAGKEGGYGEEKYEETKEGGAYGGDKGQGGGYGGGKGPKGDYGGGKGGFGEEVKEGGGYGGDKGQGGGYGGGKGPKGEYGGGKGGFGEEVKEGGAYGGDKGLGGGYGGGKGPKGGYGGGYGEEKKVYEEKEIKGGYGGGEYGGAGYGGDKKDFGGEKKYGGGGGDYGDIPKPGAPVTTLSTKGCNKMVDGLLGKLQTSFSGHMKQYKVDRISPVEIGSWARVRLYDGKFDKIGKLCRGGDFQVLPQGENIIIKGTITVPEPKAKFCGDAYLYNRLKVRNRNLLFGAKDVSYRVQMIVNKHTKKVDVDDLEPVSIHGFHVEDDKGLQSDALAWPFNKIRNPQLNKQKYQFMSQLQHKLCDDFRQVLHKPEVKEEILQLV